MMSQDLRNVVGTNGMRLDDLQQAVAERRERGVEFVDEITDRGYGLVIHVETPGDVKVQLYQPRYVKKPPRP